MIGKLVLNDETVATLEDDGKWTCSQGLLARLLNLRYSPADPLSRISDLGIYGMEHGRQAAFAFRGDWIPENKATIQPPADAVY